MIDLVARAMAEREGLDWADQSDDPYAPNCRPLWRLRACAAIAAMREPTEVMVAAGEGGVDPYSYPTFSDYDAERVWRAMIDAALPADD